MSSDDNKNSPVEKLHGAELLEWVTADGESDEKRELIVEVCAPPRKVVFRKDRDRRVPSQIVSEKPGAREENLETLDAFLSSELHLETNVLKSAGAIALRATNLEVRRFAEHPLVKAIRTNRTNRTNRSSGNSRSG